MIIKTAAAALFSVAVLFILTKLTGQRQMSQLSAFDYINGITIGSIAAEMSTEPERVSQCFVAMVIYAAVTLIISLINQHSIKLRGFLSGKCIVLYYEGKIIRKNLNKAKIDISEFLTQCRIAGYFDLSQLYAVILEPNGNLSFLPVSTERPLTPNDMQMPIPQETLQYDVIIDGRVITKNLTAVGRNEVWLRRELDSKGYKGLENIMLAVFDKQNGLRVFESSAAVTGEDIFG